MIKSQISGLILYSLTLLLFVIGCKSQEIIEMDPTDPAITSVNVPLETAISDDQLKKDIKSDSIVSGTVLNAEGESLAGVKIQLVDSAAIAFSDISGRWAIDVAGHDYDGVVISLDGYRPRKLHAPVGSSTVIIMKEGRGDSREMEREDAVFSSRARGAVTKSAEIRVAASSADASGPPAPEGGHIGRVRPGKPIAANPGLLTAGEWNDLHNWDDWEKLLDNQDYNEMQAHWRMYPQSRYSIFLRNSFELPVQDALVELLDEDDRVIWTARTDNAGSAELWADMESRDKSSASMHARVTTPKKTEVYKNLRSIEAGVNHLSIAADCFTTPQVDIFFAVDATGSMGDEIAYLQAELKDVIERSLTANASLEVRLGAVFYRDTTDSYLTQSQPLSADAQKTIDFIATQRASGGGDYPEAVDAALDVALTQDWSAQAKARIIFLLLDAPPHHNPTVLENLNNQVKEAAELGIKIIPITASGVNRQTEFLMKFMSIATNSTYVFITDHSGIGNPHLDPVVEDFEVEKLNDLMVRLLYNYTKANGCQANQDIQESIKIYPNPAKDFVTVSSEPSLRSIRILSNTGQTMGVKTDVQQDDIRLDISGLVDGIYTIQCIAEEKEYALPLVVINR